MEVLEFLFSDLWHWLGAFLIVAVLSQWRLFTISINHTEGGDDDDQS